MVFNTSCRIKAQDFESSWYISRITELASGSKRMHRKLWEFAAITQVLLDFRCGRTATQAQRWNQCLGFGVGLDPITSWLAWKNCNVLATDAPEQGPWNGQYARSIADVYNDLGGRLSLEEFYSRVAFEHVDMNAIPDHLFSQTHGNFDFTYSCGSFEHIGGIDASLLFFCNQMRCLRPGGIATHTTEYNFASDHDTINSRDLCLFRQQDLYQLRDLLAAQGDSLLPLNLLPGDRPEDRIVDPSPYTGNVHLAINVGGHVTTSIILIARRGNNPRT